MSTFVLVHGAWGGAHGFRRVRPLLHRAGHEAFTPSLTGIGERAHLTSPLVDLDVHVRDVVNQIRYEDLHDVVLLGYSYGGMVVTGTLRYLAERVRELVYLDAFVPTDGQSLYDLAGGGRAAPSVADGPGTDGLGTDGLGTDGLGTDGLGTDGLGTDWQGAEWLVPPMPREWDDPVAQQWSQQRRTPHPVGCFTKPVSLPVPLEDGPYGLTYVKAVGEPRPQPADAFWRAGDHARESPRWRYAEIDTNHLIPENKPEELVEILLSLAAT